MNWNVFRCDWVCSAFLSSFGLLTLRDDKHYDILSYLIFVTSTTSGAGGEKICHVEKLFHVKDCHVEKCLYMTNVQLEICLHMVKKKKRKTMSCGEMWSKICHVETFLHMINVETIFFVTIHADLSQNLLCCHLRCIGAKSILSRFTHFCVEKNLFRNCACGEKRTNIRYVPPLQDWHWQ